MRKKVSLKKAVSLAFIGIMLVALISNNIAPVFAQANKQSGCTSWDLVSDFRVSPNQENPNRDQCNNLNVWNFMESANLTRTPSGYTLLPNFTDSGINGVPTLGLNYWQGTYTDPS